MAAKQSICRGIEPWLRSQCPVLTVGTAMWRCCIITEKFSKISYLYFSPKSKIIVKSSTYLNYATTPDDIIIDAGGRDTVSQRAALTVADILLVPFVPRSFDIWTIEKISALIKEVQPVNPKLKGFTFLNRADAAGPDNADAAKELEEVEDLAFLDTPLGYRKAFGKAAAQGLAVTELKPADEKATQEVEELFQAVFEGSSRKAGKAKSRVMEAV